MKTPPIWLSQFVDCVIEDFQEKKVRIRFVEAATDNQRNGRCYNKQRIIIVKFTNEDKQLNRAIVLHEIAHLFIGNGRHDKCFFYLVELLYRKYGISPKTASFLEEIVPRNYWNNKKW